MSARRRSARVSGSIAISTTPELLVADNPSRVELTITNTHATVDAWLDLRVANGLLTSDPTAVVGEGILLKANGGSWTTNAYTGPVSMVVASGTGSAAVIDL